MGYATVMAITVCMAASGIIVATMRYSELRHTWINNPGQLEEFVLRGWWLRLLQFYTWGSILLYLVGLALYSLAVHHVSPFVYMLVAIFSMGTVLSLLTLIGFWVHYKRYEEHEKPKNVYSQGLVAPLDDDACRWFWGTLLCKCWHPNQE